MNLLRRAIHLLFVLQFFIPITWSQEASSTVYPSSSETSGGTTTTTGESTATATGTGTTNSTASPSTTSSAQFPSLSGVSTCVSNCLAEASANLNCSSVVDVNCFCVNPNYPNQLLGCVLGNCSSQVSIIETLGQQFCNVASGQPTLSFSPVPTTSTTTGASTSPSSISTSTSTSGSPTSSATTTSSAGFSWKFTGGSMGLMGLGVIMVLGVVLGV